MRKEPLLTAAPPAPVRSLGELYAIAFGLAEKAAQRYGALAERIDENFWPVRTAYSRSLRNASAIVATVCRQRALPPAASVPMPPTCARRRSTSFPRRKSPISEIPVCRRLTRLGRLRPAIASAPSCSGLTSSRLLKTPWCGGPRRIWHAKRCPTAICCAMSVGSPGATYRASDPFPRRTSRGIREGQAQG